MARWLADRGIAAFVLKYRTVPVPRDHTEFYRSVGQFMTALPKEDGKPPRDFLSHQVRIAPDSRLAKYLGSSQTPVNSMHHQGIKRLAEGLAANAWAPDGLIEGIEGTNGRFLIAVQWHPEELAQSDGGMRRLFTGFIDAANDFRHSSAAAV